MLVEDATYNSSGTLTDTVRMAAGARGVDGRIVWGSSGTTYEYPVYDAHGNTVALLKRSGGGYLVSDRKSYDPWGNLRKGDMATPKQRYGGNLGHITDDESSHVYMRARYYEPWRGRFISEDPARDGLNWQIYANNAPTVFADPSGSAAFLVGGILAGFLIALTVSMANQAGRADAFNYALGAFLDAADEQSLRDKYQTAFKNPLPEGFGDWASLLGTTAMGTKMGGMLWGSGIRAGKLLGKLGIAGAIGYVSGWNIGCIEAMLFYIDNCV